jgi:hypothetical protein
MLRFYAELFAGDDNSDIMGAGSTHPRGRTFVPPSLPHNITRRAIESVVARIAKERPLPNVLTDEGDYSAYKRAKRMTRAIEGGFSYLDVFKVTPRCLRDACIGGSGVLKVWREGDKPRIARVMPWELRVDAQDARYGDPRCLYHETWVDKGVLKRLAKEWKSGRGAMEAIDMARTTTDEYGYDVSEIAEHEDRVLVTEAWHLPSGQGAKDGRHIIAIAGDTGAGSVRALLVDEKWERATFPFAIINYKEPLAGFWGESLSQELCGYQIEINLISERVRTAHHLAGTGIWLVPETSGLLESDFTNAVAPVLFHRPGMKPDHFNPEPVSQATYGYLLDLIRMGPEASGMNEQVMHGQKPAGVTAAKAIQSLKDETSELMAMPAAAWDAFHVRIGELLVDTFCEIAEEHGDFSLKAKTKRGSKEYVWRDVTLPRDAFTLQVQPASMLAKTPGARIQQVYDLFNSQVISRTLFLKLLDAPDIDAESDLEAAPQLLVDEQINWMLEHDDPDAPDAYQAPLPLMDLTYALHRAQCHWAFGKMRQVSPENLELLLDWMRAVRDLQAIAAGVPGEGAVPGGPIDQGPPPEAEMLSAPPPEAADPMAAAMPPVPQ